MNIIKIKPLSVNRVRQWKRFKTKIYKEYEEIVKFILKPTDIPEWKLHIDYIFWFSSKLSDIDNPIKPFQDILCKKYWFDDRRIYSFSADKKIVKKGQEFVAFNIKKYIEPNNPFWEQIKKRLKKV